LSQRDNLHLLATFLPISIDFAAFALPKFAIGRRAWACYNIRPPGLGGVFNTHLSRFMSQHRSLRAASTLGGKRNVLKRYERVELLRKTGEWKEGARITGLRKVKPPV
jgi:small basic protein (TIGR04137 family)